MRSEIGVCVHALRCAAWRWVLSSRGWCLVENHHALHVRDYWRARLASLIGGEL